MIVPTATEKHRNESRVQQESPGGMGHVCCQFRVAINDVSDLAGSLLALLGRRYRLGLVRRKDQIPNLTVCTQWAERLAIQPYFQAGGVANPQFGGLFAFDGLCLIGLEKSREDLRAIRRNRKPGLFRSSQSKLYFGTSRSRSIALSRRGSSHRCNRGRPGCNWGQGSRNRSAARSSLRGNSAVLVPPIIDSRASY
jgi:hypothetical protein